MSARATNATHADEARNLEVSAFVHSGLASIFRSEMAGDWVPADAVVARLEAKLAAARGILEKRST